MAKQTFSAQSLAGVISKYDCTSDYLVAYSGGLDSHVLLHALSSLASKEDIKISAIHVNHGLSPNSQQWTEHCQIVCRQLRIPLKIISVHARSESGDSPEAFAREARYSVLTEYLGRGQALVTAHHMDDQAETFLLQLLRGAGLRGLSSMPAYQDYANGWIIRPLLGFSRESLREYAMVHDLEWIEDESNSDTAFDRNYLRHMIMPLLLDRWPSAHRTLARAASHAADTSSMADMLARQDRIKTMRCKDSSLSVSSLRSLDVTRRYNLLRTWIRDSGFSVPSTKVVERIDNEVLHAVEDSMPLVEWPGAQVRRYHQRIYLLPPLPPAPGRISLPWNLDNSVALPVGELRARHVLGDGLSAERCRQTPLVVRFRQTGESLRPAWRNRTIALKKLLQDSGVPPWLRGLVPLIYAGDTIVAVAGIAIHEDWQSRDGEPGYLPVWKMPLAFSVGMPEHIFEARE